MPLKRFLDSPPKGRTQQMDVYIPQRDDDWTNEAYDWLNGGQRRRRGGGWAFSRVLTACFSGVLIAIGMTCVALGSASTVKYQMHMTYAGGIVFGFIASSVGAIGVVSVWIEKTVFSVVFSISLGVVSLILFSLGSASAAMLARPEWRSDFLRTAWEDGVSGDPRFICDVQNHFHCSGYNPSHCCVSNATSTPHGSPCYLIADGRTLDPVTLKEVTWPAAECAPCGDTNIYNETCAGPLMGFFPSLLIATISVLFSCGAIFIVFCVIAGCRAVRFSRTTSHIRYEY